MKKLPQNKNILRASKKVKNPTVKMTRAEVIRGSKMDPSLPKL